MTLPYNAPRAYQPPDRDLTELEKERIKADTDLIEVLIREKEADVKKKEEDAKSAGLRYQREEMDLERSQLYLDDQRVRTDREQRRERRDLAEEGMLGKYDFTKAIMGEQRNFFGGVTPSTIDPFMQRIERFAEKNPGSNIEIMFSSPGGSVYDGYRFYSFLRELSAAGHEIITGARGMTASMAGVMLQAGDHRTMSAYGKLLIHQVSAHGISGSAEDVADQLEEMRELNAQCVDVFMERAENITRGEFEDLWYRRDWRLTAHEALEYNFIDEIIG